MNKGSIVERLCSDVIAKSRDINGLLYFTFTGCSITVAYGVPTWHRGRRRVEDNDEIWNKGNRQTVDNWLPT